MQGRQYVLTGCRPWRTRAARGPEPAPVVYDNNSSDIQRVHLVKEGECVSGRIAFVVGGEPDGAFLEFTNSAGDRIDWQLP